MTARFVLDESSWAGATRVTAEVLADAIWCFLERGDAARERDETVVRHANFHETDLGDGVRLFAAIFDSGCSLRLDRDLAERLSLMLDRASDFADSGLSEYDAVYAGRVWFAPGVAWAHASCSQRGHVAVLPLALDGVPTGRVPVTVAGVTVDVNFVVEESEHTGFFRSIIALENADEETFGCLARSAFPALEWADGIWDDLGKFSRPYIDVRDGLVRCLGGLNDHGARSFHEHLASDQPRLAAVLSARIGAETSDENGRTKRHPPCRRDRTRRHQGVEKVFWWHVKLRPHVDRIHFLYEPRPEGSPAPERGRIVVGLFKDHCVLLN